MSYRETRKILDTSAVYQHGKTQVPRRVRQLLQVKDKDVIVWFLEDGKVIVEKA